jgi:hypothetical protein
MSTLHVVGRLRGGAEVDSKNLSAVADRLGISLSSLPDMITMDDDPTDPRAEMSCGHAITASSCYSYAAACTGTGTSTTVTLTRNPHNHTTTQPQTLDHHNKRDPTFFSVV